MGVHVLCTPYFLHEQITRPLHAGDEQEDRGQADTSRTALGYAGLALSPSGRSPPLPCRRSRLLVARSEVCDVSHTHSQTTHTMSYAGSLARQILPSGFCRRMGFQGRDRGPSGFASASGLDDGDVMDS